MAARCSPPGGAAPKSSSKTPGSQTQSSSLKSILSKQRTTLLSDRGYLSIWPASVSGQTVRRNHKPCCAPEETQSNKQALLTTPKPPYLEQLESYLRKELQSLELTKNHCQELKLQPYRDIFESILETFTTYSPLLAAIKKEYEVTLADQKKTIRALEHLKAKISIVSEECTQKILAVQEKTKHEINMLKQEKQHLLKLIDNMKEEKSSLQTQVEHLQKSVTVEYTRYLNEQHAHRMLLAQLNSMHCEQQDRTQAQAQDKGEDVQKLMLALKVTQRDLTKAQVKLNKMEADYGDVVPRRDFEALEKKYSDLLQEMKPLQKDLDELRNKYEALLEAHRETVAERDSLCAQLEQARRSCTPRPRWAKCSEVIPGGADQWGSLAKGKSSDELVDVLLEEIGTRRLRDIDFFPGWGKDDTVPAYLRHEGDVENKKLTKKAVVNILKDVWKEKIALEQQTGQRHSLPEFFLSYLQQKHGDAAAMEWSYNLYENMRLCPSNPVLSSFYNVLTEKVSEDYYHSQNRIISNLQQELAAHDSSNSGSLTSEQFSAALRETFPLKRKESIQELLDVSRVRLDSAQDLIDYRSLFREDEEGNTEPFVAKLRSQDLQEKQEYLRQLKNELGDLTGVNACDLKTAFRAIDPDTDAQTLDTYVGLVCREPEDVVDVETALGRLRAGDVRRTGPSPREGGGRAEFQHCK